MMVKLDLKKDFSRDVVCLLGIPFDIIDMKSAARRVNQAAVTKNRCIISTPNTNFIITSGTNHEFLTSVLNSDMNLVDGVPLLLISRLLKLSIPERVAGSDLLDYLNKTQLNIKTKFFFFGAKEGISEKAAAVANKTEQGLKVKDFYYPGYTSVENMSSDSIIEIINTSGADFLILSLGAVKGQKWIEYNKSKLSVPVISHLGAAVNFTAGSLKRAPGFIQKYGLEWLWRIKQEPKLWKRYFFDGIGLIKLLATRVFPYFLYLKLRARNIKGLFEREIKIQPEDTLLILKGAVTHDNIEEFTQVLYECFLLNKNVSIDAKELTFIDSFAMAKLFVLEKHLRSNNKNLHIMNADKRIGRIFYWNGAERLLS